TTFYPMLHASRLARGRSLFAEVDCPELEAGKYGSVPALETAVAYDEEKGEAAVFAVNRSLDEDMDLAIKLSGYGKPVKTEHIALRCSDLKAVNSADRPDAVLPEIISPDKKTVLSKHSWNVIRFSY
ncbi:MAG: alpha-N-arabinofuranosidase, partial [Oscillospiraceae bacterium]|nr:alpha-N-arabinofuranosidase [Oscillospiraceae bacterium]